MKIKLEQNHTKIIHFCRKKRGRRKSTHNISIYNKIDNGVFAPGLFFTGRMNKKEGKHTSLDFAGLVEVQLHPQKVQLL